MMTEIINLVDAFRQWQLRELNMAHIRPITIRLYAKHQSGKASVMARAQAIIYLSHD
jgi:hypothetical protein